MENEEKNVVNNDKQPEGTVKEKVVTPVTPEKPKKKTGLIIGIIVGVLALLGLGIIVLVVLVVLVALGIFSVATTGKDKLVCKSNRGNVTIYYDDNGITGYSEVNYDFDEDQEKIKFNRYGKEFYIKNFKSNYESKTGGTCTVEESDDDVVTTPTVTEGKFVGDGFTIEYKTPWYETSAKNTKSEDMKVLAYDKTNEVYFYPLGTSALDEVENVDFTTYSGRSELYDQFYEYWGKNENVTKEYSFRILKDNIYYSTMTYKNDSTQGRLYLVVSTDNNIILSFQSVEKTTSYTNYSNTVSLLKNINIDKIYNDTLAKGLDTLSNWNMYKSVRSGSLGKKKEITGGWLMLDTADQYFVFKDNGDFYYYNSYKDLTNNYYYGTYTVKSGKAALVAMGIDSTNIDKILANNKELKESDLLAVKLTVKTRMIDGKDTSSEMSTKELDNVFILVDHGSEGIEGQRLNVANSNTSYFVKISD